MEIPYQQGTLFSALKILVQSCSRLADRFPASQAKAKIAPIWRPFFLSLPDLTGTFCTKWKEREST